MKKFLTELLFVDVVYYDLRRYRCSIWVSSRPRTTNQMNFSTQDSYCASLEILCYSLILIWIIVRELKLKKKNIAIGSYDPSRHSDHV